MKKEDYTLTIKKEDIPDKDYHKIPNGFWNIDINPYDKLVLGSLLSHKDGFKLNKTFIAKGLNMSRQFITKSLNRLEKNKLINISKGVITINMVTILTCKQGLHGNEDNMVTEITPHVNQNNTPCHPELHGHVNGDDMACKQGLHGNEDNMVTEITPHVNQNNTPCHPELHGHVNGDDMACKQGLHSHVNGVNTNNTIQDKLQEEIKQDKLKQEENKQDKILGLDSNLISNFNLNLFKELKIKAPNIKLFKFNILTLFLINKCNINPNSITLNNYLEIFKDNDKLNNYKNFNKLINENKQLLTRN